MTLWLHAPEESSDEELVFRPDGYRLRPARGRLTLEIDDDGSIFTFSPGPDDRPVASPPPEGWVLAESGEDRVILRKQA